MIAVRIPDTRKFLSDLFSHETFDSFVLGEAQITTCTTFRIDGTWHPDYYGEKEEAPAGPEEPSWKRLRPVVSGIVRGNHSPLSFRIVLKLPGSATESVIRKSGITGPASQADGLFINIVYQNKEVTCTSGTSMKTFTLDRSLEHVWDDMMVKFFASRGIAAETL